MEGLQEACWLREIPLLKHHVAAGAEVGEFAGWKSPIFFTKLRDEHMAVRQKAGIFDITHMTRTKISGPSATDLLQKTLTCDVATLKKGRMKYGLILNERAGIVDDMTVFKVEEGSYVMVSNAATREKVLQWMRRFGDSNVLLDDFTDNSAYFAVQGPMSSKVVSEVLQTDVSALKWFAGVFVRWGGCELLVTRSGYTGEDGYEIMVLCGGVELYKKLWDAFISSGVKPCGLACRDTCRMEAGYLLSGVDFDESKTPVEAGLMWAVKMEKEGFVGKEALVKLTGRKPAQTAVLLEMVEQGIPRHGYKVCKQNGEEVGYVTSGVLSPLNNRGLAIAYVETDYAGAGTELFVDIRGTMRRSVVRAEPLVRVQKH
jgi:aminomethyltransferase